MPSPAPGLGCLLLLARGLWRTGMWDWWWKVTPAPRIITKLPPSLSGHPPATNLLLSVFQCSELCPACMSHESYFYSVQYSRWAGHRHCMFMNASITA